MYIHQKTSSIEKNIKNVLSFIHGIENDVKKMNTQHVQENVGNNQIFQETKIVVSDNEYENEYENNTESDDDSEIENQSSNIKNIVENRDLIDINTSPLHNLFNIQIVKTMSEETPVHENTDEMQVAETIGRNDLNQLNVTDLRKQMRQYDSSISSTNIKKMKKQEMIDFICQHETDNDISDISLNIMEQLQNNESAVENADENQ